MKKLAFRAVIVLGFLSLSACIKPRITDSGSEESGFSNGTMVKCKVTMPATGRGSDFAYTFQSLITTAAVDGRLVEVPASPARHEIWHKGKHVASGSISREHDVAKLPNIVYRAELKPSRSDGSPRVIIYTIMWRTKPWRISVYHESDSKVAEGHSGTGECQ